MTLESSAGISDRGEFLPAIQYLRGIAAAMVLLAHSCSFAMTAAPALSWLRPIKNLGLLGVAIFFVLSGFIMVVTCLDRWNGSVAVAAEFMRRRLRRILPLYWMITLLQIVILILAKSDDPSFGFGVREIALSLLLIPYDFDGQAFLPILSVGWTLSFEMLFYLIFASGLLLPRAAGLIAIEMVLLGLACLGQIVRLSSEPLAALAQPVLLLFALGMTLGLLRNLRSERLPHWASSAMILALTPVSAVLLWPLPEPRSQLQPYPLLWILAAMTVAVAAFSEGGRPLGSASRCGLALGAASYFLYLIHPIVLQVVAEAVERTGIEGAARGWTILASGVLLSVSIALIGHRFIERPMMLAVRRTR